MKSRNDLRVAFEKIDTDKSGSIEVNELQSLCSSVGCETNPDELTTLFNDMDTNKDGQVSFDEFVAWYRLGRDSNLKKGLKGALKAANFYTSKVVPAFKNQKQLNLDGRVSLFDVDVQDGDNWGASTYEMRASTQMDDLMRERLATALPDFDVSGNDKNFVYHMQKSTNPGALRDKVVECYETVKAMFGEDHGLAEMISQVNLMTGLGDDYVVFVAHVDCPMADDMVGMGIDLMDLVSTHGEPELNIYGGSSSTIKTIMAAENWLHVAQDFKFRTNLSVAQSSYSTLLEVVHGMMGQGNDQVDLPAILGKLFSGFRLKLRFNSSTHQDGAKGDANDVQAGIMHAHQQVMQAMGQPMPPMNLDMNQMPFKNWPECKQFLQDNANCPQNPVPAMAQQFPVVEDFLNAFRDYGLQDSTTAVVVNQCVMCARSKGEGLKELFTELQGCLNPK